MKSFMYQYSQRFTYEYTHDICKKSRIISRITTKDKVKTKPKDIKSTVIFSPV